MVFRVSFGNLYRICWWFLEIKSGLDISTTWPALHSQNNKYWIVYSCSSLCREKGIKPHKRLDLTQTIATSDHWFSWQWMACNYHLHMVKKWCIGWNMLKHLPTPGDLPRNWLGPLGRGTSSGAWRSVMKISTGTRSSPTLTQTRWNSGHDVKNGTIRNVDRGIWAKHSPTLASRTKNRRLW